MNIPKKDTGIRRENDLMMEAFIKEFSEADDRPRYGDPEGYSKNDGYESEMPGDGYESEIPTGMQPADAWRKLAPIIEEFVSKHDMQSGSMDGYDEAYDSLTNHFFPEDA